MNLASLTTSLAAAAVPRPCRRRAAPLPDATLASYLVVSVCFLSRCFSFKLAYWVTGLGAMFWRIVGLDVRDRTGLDLSMSVTFGCLCALALGAGPWGMLCAHTVHGDGRREHLQTRREPRLTYAQIGGLIVSLERPMKETSHVLQDMLGDIAGLKALDIGAGDGAVTSVLAELGAEATGLEPNPDLAERARARGMAADVIVASAEAMGPMADVFDLAVFSMSLHHVPNMANALKEAHRVTKSGGRILVIEPEADDPMAPVMGFIDDESALLAAAQRALLEAARDGLIRPGASLRFWQKYRVSTPDDMLADVISIDSDRSLKPADRGAFEAAFATAFVEDEAGGYLPYWGRADLFSCLS